MTDPGFEALLALQDLDATLDRLRHRLRALPERAELTELTARSEMVGARRAAVVSVRDEVAGREQVLEEELRATEDRAKEVERRLYSGEVSAARELQAMSDDVAALRVRAAELEDRALEVLTEREPLDTEVAGFDADLAAIEETATTVRARLAEAEADVKAELGEVEGKRSEVAAGVPATLVPEYDRLRVRLGGVAVARLIGSRCDGCHLTLSASEVERIRHQPPDAVVTCDNCGRILIRS